MHIIQFKSNAFKRFKHKFIKSIHLLIGSVILFSEKWDYSKCQLQLVLGHDQFQIHFLTFVTALSKFKRLTPAGIILTIYFISQFCQMYENNGQLQNNSEDCHWHQHAAILLTCRWQYLMLFCLQHKNCLYEFKQLLTKLPYCLVLCAAFLNHYFYARAQIHL